MGKAIRVKIQKGSSGFIRHMTIGKPMPWARLTLASGDMDDHESRATNAVPAKFNRKSHVVEGGNV
jgi:hypothetical protein